MDEGQTGDMCGSVMKTLVPVESAIDREAKKLDGLVGKDRYSRVLAKHRDLLVDMDVVQKSEVALWEGIDDGLRSLDGLAGVKTVFGEEKKYNEEGWLWFGWAGRHAGHVRMNNFPLPCSPAFMFFTR